MVRFINWFSKFDQFGGRIPIKLKDQDSLQTGRGSMITLLMFTFFLIQAENLVEMLITHKDPSIQSYDVHQIAKEPVDLIENRMPIAFQIRGTGDGRNNTINPRAG